MEMAQGRVRRVSVTSAAASESAAAPVPVPPPVPRRRLTADDWADAALAAIGDGGVAAVAVEPIAASLGATKGSFYWHFDSRDALVRAALARWEERSTETVIESLRDEPDPAQRLRLLVHRVIAHAGRDRVEVNLLAAADHPLVEPVLRRVTQRRMEYVVSLFRAIGLPPREARRRGLLAYSAYVGHAQLAARLPGLLPEDGPEPRRYLDAMLTVLLCGVSTASSAPS
jgi:AcrR family transcriptional regulator